MFKALLKKQFYELNQSFFVSRKNGKAKSKGEATRSIVFFVVIMIFVCVMFYFLTSAMADMLLSDPSGQLDWFFFAIMGIMAILLGTFGSVFNTMSALYKAKDNELLLSMPIPPLYILVTRMVAVYAMSLLYTALVWAPTMVRYFNTRGWSAGLLILNIVLLLLIALLVTVLACVAGWIVAMISGKLRNRSIVTVIISLILFGVYYFICFRLNTILQTIVAKNEEVGRGIRTFVYPVYEMGQAATGKISAFLIFAAISIALFAICCYVLSRSFVKIITLNKGLKKVEYVEKAVQTRSIKNALYFRERTHFLKNSTYMLNCGLGLAFLPVLTVLALIYKNKIRGFEIDFTYGEPALMEFVVFVICAAICLMLSMNMITAPSVSLEGHSIWLAQSLPVRTIDILHAKERLHISMNIIPALVCTVILGWIFLAPAQIIVLMVVIVALHTVFTAEFGLWLNLKHPNLDWTNEAVPIKQSSSIAIGMFAGWGICIAPVVLYYLVFMKFMSVTVFMVICCAALALIVFLLEKWMRGKGSEIFETL